jgi:hypothetical protein
MDAQVLPYSGSIATDLLALEQERRSDELHTGRDQAESETADIQLARAAQQRAEAEAREQAEHASTWGTFLDVAKDVAAAGAVAAAAFTGGSSLVVAAAIIGGVGAVGADVAKRTGLISEKSAMWIELGSAVLSGGAGAAQLLGAGGTAAATETAATVKAAGGATSATGTAAAGVATCGKAYAQSREASAEGDAAEANSNAEEAKDGFDDALNAIERSVQDFTRASAVASQIEAIGDEISTSLVQAIRG